MCLVMSMFGYKCVCLFLIVSVCLVRSVYVCGFVCVWLCVRVYVFGYV